VTYQTHIEHLASMKADCVVAGVWAKKFLLKTPQRQKLTPN